MAQSVEVKVWCDWHLTQEEEVPGVPFTLAWSTNGGKLRPVDLDLCAEHLEPLVAQLQAVAELGRLQAKAPKAAKQVAAFRDGKPAKQTAPNGRNGRPKSEALPRGEASCPDCGETVKAWATLKNHWTQVHPTATLSLDEAYGLPILERCTQCGQGFNTGQALQGHKRARHPQKSKGRRKAS